MGRIQMVNMEELREKWIDIIANLSNSGEVIRFFKGDKEELLLLLKQPVNPFTKEELDAHFWMLEHRSLDEDVYIKGVPCDVMENFYKFEKKAKKLRDEL
jgi:hypothetical protein